MKPKWIPTILMVQLVLVFLCPVIELNFHITRKIFLSDLWCLVWVSCFLLSKDFYKDNKVLYKTAFMFGVVGVWVFLQGFFRSVSVVEKLGPVGIFYHQNDAFEFFRELTVMIRVLVWVVAGLISFKYVTELKDVKKIFYTMVGCVVAASIIMIFDYFIPGFHNLTGKLYGYNPGYVGWVGRIYGTFQSPVEAGIAFALTSVFCMSLCSFESFKNFTIAIIGIIFSITGLFFSKTLTPLIALLVASGLIIGAKISKKSTWLLPVFLVTVCYFFIHFFSSNILVQTKISDLFSRVVPWKIYAREQLSSWRTILFGYGFTNYHIDNFYLFVLNRGGIFLFLSLSVYFGVKIKKYWPRWIWRQRAILLYLLIVGTMFDVLILRHVINLMIAVGLPLLAVQLKKKV